MTKRSFDFGKPHVRPPRCDARVALGDKRRFMAQRAAEVAQRRTLFDYALAVPAP